MLLKSNDLLVLIINDMVILPGNEVRVEYSNIYDENINNILNKRIIIYLFLYKNHYTSYFYLDIIMNRK